VSGTKKPKGRLPTRTELAALHRALDLAELTIAHYRCIEVALRRSKPETLRRELKRIRELLRGTIA